MLDDDLLTAVIFKLSSEDDVNKLAHLNNMIIRRIQLLQVMQRCPPAAPQAKQEEPPVDNPIMPK